MEIHPKYVEFSLRDILNARLNKLGLPPVKEEKPPENKTSEEKKPEKK